ncbi:HAD-IB family phosphatase [Pyrococcus horikoshii]|nr:HAD-IB family phosphatase [Pyrococcus horikoshii]HII61745.1 HAD-IB family phosphatase [Pyrococcus horikoshii]
MMLIAFDLEGTLTDMVSWELLHKKFETCGLAKKNAELFFSGRISYEEWAKLDASLWKGRRREEVEEVFKEVSLKDYAEELFRWLKEKGFKTAIITGGLMCLAKKVAEKLNPDYVYANELVFNEKGEITGDVIVRVTFDNKGEILERLKRELNPTLTVAVGDWKNDLPMFEVADISISLGEDHADYLAKDLREVKKILKEVLLETEKL